MLLSNYFHLNYFTFKTVPLHIQNGERLSSYIQGIESCTLLLDESLFYKMTAGE